MVEHAVSAALAPAAPPPESRPKTLQKNGTRLGLDALLLWGLLVASGGALGVENSSPAALRLVELEREIATDYADITHISVADLKSNYTNALLVDVRAAKEYERSHLPGALHAPTSVQVDELRQRYPDRDLVLYCTVGVRSSIAVRDLLAREAASPSSSASPSGNNGSASAPAAGGGRVVNLVGSIFAWANQGEPLENANGPTHDVHPFNAWWGFRYLDRNRPLPALESRAPVAPRVEAND